MMINSLMRHYRNEKAARVDGLFHGAFSAFIEPESYRDGQQVVRRDCRQIEAADWVADDVSVVEADN